MKPNDVRGRTFLERDDDRLLFLVIGGGCYGSHYVKSLCRAIDRNRLPKSDIWIIDRDSKCAAFEFSTRKDVRLVVSSWNEFFCGQLRGWREGLPGPSRVLLVPAPLTPHLFFHWLVAAVGERSEVKTVEPPTLPGTPFARRSPAGGMALSFAEWRCPTHCVEPFLCPATRQRRDWEISHALTRFARELRLRLDGPLWGPFLARCTHLIEGVGFFPLGDWVSAARRIEKEIRRGPGYSLIGTVSGCHGVGNLLRLGKKNTLTPGGKFATCRD